MLSPRTPWLPPQGTLASSGAPLAARAPASLTLLLPVPQGWSEHQGLEGRRKQGQGKRLYRALASPPAGCQLLKCGNRLCRVPVAGGPGPGRLSPEEGPGTLPSPRASLHAVSAHPVGEEQVCGEGNAAQASSSFSIKCLSLLTLMVTLVTSHSGRSLVMRRVLGHGPAGHPDVKGNMRCSNERGALLRNKTARAQQRW